MHTVNEMIILQLSYSAPSHLPVGSVVTFISSFQHVFLFTKVYSALPLPSAGVCRMSPDVSYSIGLYDMPFTSNKLQQSVFYNLVPLHRSHYTQKHTHPRFGFLHQYAVNTMTASHYRRPKSNFTARVRATKWDRSAHWTE